jgi:hypothetical protein
LVLRPVDEVPRVNNDIESHQDRQPRPKLGRLNGIAVPPAMLTAFSKGEKLADLPVILTCPKNFGPT